MSDNFNNLFSKVKETISDYGNPNDLHQRSENKLRCRVAGNIEMTDLQEKLKALPEVKDAAVFYDGECRTFISVVV